MVPTAQNANDPPCTGPRCQTERLRRENEAFEGTGGISRENRSAGFVPGFLDTASGRVYRSCFADGRPAPIHLFDGLPGHLVSVIGKAGNATAEGARLVSGFLRAGRFYTRQEAADAMRQPLDA
jgi:hypothetical protein